MKRVAPATSRNREPILAVLRRVFPARGRALEIASGSGEHAVFFAAAFPELEWLPTDVDPEAIDSIESYRSEAALPNLSPARTLDVRDDDWGVGAVDAILSCNMIHIAPWPAAEGLLRGAGRHLAPGGVAVVYGPFRVGGTFEAPSNAAFDASLRARDPAWGVRDLELVTACAEAAGLQREEVLAMPANNLSVVFWRLTGGPPRSRSPAPR